MMVMIGRQVKQINRTCGGRYVYLLLLFQVSSLPTDDADRMKVMKMLSKLRIDQSKLISGVRQ